ncbi:Wall-associated kinase family protein [Rhynchospora pubera]|uniref:Wall-associated kinase family protein n=1 Tax=Rhynchospora pubera TaxID=906938 RepID=A0AAV8E7P3_9POAL|nr:Wall-associated kinase family protein [Rhynchospora pubera]
MNNRQIAIKRSKTIGERELKEFGKEILILSQVNHKNIVKSLGCCLEVEIPILVFEFISEGTLFDLLHGKLGISIPLGTRLRIAQEAAEALAYLHSWASPPIVHRDIKTSNILLDENFVAKVSDFGASVLAPGGHDQFVTHVLGTRGYLDPEYLQSGQLTVKSDVYSFGVVLIELLTRKKAFRMEGMETRCLVADFLSSTKDSNVATILDDEISKNRESMRQITEVLKLASECLHIEGEKRPKMQQVAATLDSIRAVDNMQYQVIEIS